MVLKINSRLLNKTATWWIVLSLIEQPITFFLESLNIPWHTLVSSIIIHVCFLGGLSLVALSLVDEPYRNNIFLFVFVFFILFINLLAYPENKEASVPIIKNTLITITAFYAVVYLRDYNRVMDIIAKIGYIIFPLTTYARIFLRSQIYRDYADFAIMIFPFVLVFCCQMIMKPTVVNSLLSVGGLLSLLMFGNRTSFLLVTIGIILIFYKKKPSRIILGTLVFVPLLIIFEGQLKLLFNNLMGSFISFFDRNSVYSRTIYVFQNQNWLWLSGRESYYQNAFNLIKQSPIIGNGVGSDMIYNFNNLGYTTAERILTGEYSHNGFLEMGVEFGVVIATIVWTWIIIKSITKFLAIEYDDGKFPFFLLLLLYGIGRTFLGYPYWYNWYFWGAIALLVVNTKEHELSK